MKKVTIIMVLMLAFSLSFSNVYSENVQEFLRTGEGVERIFVRMQDTSMIAGENYMQYLKDNAEASQKGLLNDLSSRSDELNIESFWSFNAVAMDADVELIEEISQREDVKEIFEVPEMELFNQNKPYIYTRATDGDGLVYGLKTMNVDRVWKDFGIKGNNVVTGVIDSGINYNLDIFEGKLLGGKNFAGDPDEYHDDNGHGTHVAGTVVGDYVNDDLYQQSWWSWTKVGHFEGNIGVAPEADLYFARCMDADGGISFDNVLKGLEWLASKGVQVANASLGSSSHQPHLREPLVNIQKTGTMLVFAAGNSGSKVGSPADIPEIFSIGAVDSSDNKASFSSIGPATWDDEDYIKPDVMAPGVSVISYYNDKLAGVDGTSMASPNTTGVIALLLEANPNLSIEEIKRVLKETALDLGSDGVNNQYGHGRIDAYAAVAAVTGKNEFKSKIYQYDAIRNAIVERAETLDDSIEAEREYLNMIQRKDDIVDDIVDYINNNSYANEVLLQVANEDINLFEIFELIK
ncbi:MAG: S8 family peptidase [Candidatus Muiribacteriota bacterium]